MPSRRGESKRTVAAVRRHLERTLGAAEASHTPLREYLKCVDALARLRQFAANARAQVLQAAWNEFEEAQAVFAGDAVAWIASRAQAVAAWKEAGEDNGALNKAAERLGPLVETSRDLVKQADRLFKLALRVIDACEAAGGKESHHWNRSDVMRACKDADQVRKQAVEQLKKVRHFHRQAHRLQERSARREATRRVAR